MRLKAFILSGLAAAGLLAGATLPAGADLLPLMRPGISVEAAGAPVVRIDNRRKHQNRGFYGQNGRYYYNGHRGYRKPRQGYQQFNGWWFPSAAFAFGFSTGPGYAPPQRHAAPPRYAAPRHARGYSPAHYQWCDQRYRSYRASDNSFQPYNGPRRGCVSPYAR